MDLAGGGGGKGWDNGERNMETNITIYKRDSQREFAAWLRELKLGLSNNLNGRDGEGGGRGGQVGGDMGKPVADSHWCLVETNTIMTQWAFI